MNRFHINGPRRSSGVRSCTRDMTWEPRSTYPIHQLAIAGQTDVEWPPHRFHIPSMNGVDKLSWWDVHLLEGILLAIHLIVNNYRSLSINHHYQPLSVCAYICEVITHHCIPADHTDCQASPLLFAYVHKQLLLPLASSISAEPPETSRPNLENQWSWSKQDNRWKRSCNAST